MSLKIGLQLYSIKEETAKDFRGALKKVAAMGYEGVEFAGYGDLTSKELKALLAELHLVPCGSHVSIEQLENNLDEVVRYNKEIQNPYVICPWAAFSDRVNIQSIIEILKNAAIKCSENGLKLGYHNHAHEFELFGNEVGLDILAAELGDQELFLELDTYWAYDAGYDPTTYMKKHSGRFELLHIKDMKETENGRESTEIGSVNGIMDFKPIIEEAEKQGTKWLIVEQEHFTGDPMQSVEICCKELKKLI